MKQMMTAQDVEGSAGGTQGGCAMEQLLMQPGEGQPQKASGGGDNSAGV